MLNWRNQIPNYCHEMRASAKNENDQIRKIVFPVLLFDLVQSPTILQHGTLHSSVGKNIISSLQIQFWSRQIRTLFCSIKDTKSQERKFEKSDFVAEAFYLFSLLVKWQDFSYGKSFSNYAKNQVPVLSFTVRICIFHWLILYFRFRDRTERRQWYAILQAQSLPSKLPPRSAYPSMEEINLPPPKMYRGSPATSSCITPGTNSTATPKKSSRRSRLGAQVNHSFSVPENKTTASPRGRRRSVAIELVRSIKNGFKDLTEKTLKRRNSIRLPIPKSARTESQS